MQLRPSIDTAAAGLVTTAAAEGSADGHARTRSAGRDAAAEAADASTARTPRHAHVQ